MPPLSCNFPPEPVNCDMRRLIIMLIWLTGVGLYLGCDQGLSPADSSVGEGPSGISGTVYFPSWPPADSLYDLRIVVFKVYPPDDIVTALLTGQAVAYPPIDSTHLPFYVDSLNYTIELPPGRYEAVTVVYRFGPVILSDWALVGVYHRPDAPTDTIPDPVTVEEGQITTDIDIQVHFQRHISLNREATP